MTCTGKTRRSPPQRRIALWLALLPFLALSLIAPGVMPARAADGTMVLVLCTPEGPQELIVDPGSGPDSHKDDARCDWAQGQPGAPLDAAPASLPAMLTAGRTASLAAHPLFRPAHDPRGIFARGPPALL